MYSDEASAATPVNQYVRFLVYVFLLRSWTGTLRQHKRAPGHRLNVGSSEGRFHRDGLDLDPSQRIHPPSAVTRGRLLRVRIRQERFCCLRSRPNSLSNGPFSW